LDLNNFAHFLMILATCSWVNRRKTRHFSRFLTSREINSKDIYVVSVILLSVLVSKDRRVFSVFLIHHKEEAEMCDEISAEKKAS